MLKAKTKLSGMYGQQANKGHDIWDEGHDLASSDQDIDVEWH